VNHVTLYLKNSGAVTGELVKQTDDAVTLRWDYGDVTFSRQEIQRIVRGREVEEEDDIVLPQSVQEARQWRYQHGVVFRLLNGNVLDAELMAVDAANLYLRQAVGAQGAVELMVPRAQLDQLMFRPIDNERSAKIRAALEETFPRMRWFEEGMFSILTDSSKPAVNSY